MVGLSRKGEMDSGQPTKTDVHLGSPDFQDQPQRILQLFPREAVGQTRLISCAAFSAVCGGKTKSEKGPEFGRKDLPRSSV